MIWPLESHVKKGYVLFLHEILSFFTGMEDTLLVLFLLTIFILGHSSGGGDPAKPLHSYSPKKKEK